MKISLSLLLIGWVLESLPVQAEPQRELVKSKVLNTTTESTSQVENGKIKYFQRTIQDIQQDYRITTHKSATNSIKVPFEVTTQVPAMEIKYRTVKNGKLIGIFKDTLGGDWSSYDFSVIKSRIDDGTMTIDKVASLLKTLSDGNPDLKDRIDRGAMTPAQLVGSLDLTDLMSWNVLTNTRWYSEHDTSYPYYDFHGKPLYTAALSQVLELKPGVNDWDNAYGKVIGAGMSASDRNDLNNHLRDAAQGNLIHDPGMMPFTTAHMIEASRLARIYQLLKAGAIPPMATVSGTYPYVPVLNGVNAWTPFTVACTADAVLAQLKEVFASGVRTGSPIALDLNHDGKIGVTGKSSAKVRQTWNAFVMAGSVLFDLRGRGKLQRWEWLKGDGDGFLVYDGGGVVSKAAAAGEAINGRQLLGDAIGYDHGFQKLALLGAGIQTAASNLKRIPGNVMACKELKGDMLKSFKVWCDSNCDAQVQPEELKTLDALGITAIGVNPKFVKNQEGEGLIQSYFVQSGKRYMTEDVWFAEGPNE